MERKGAKEHLMSFNELELACKEFYNSKDGMLMTIPQSIEEVKKILSSADNRQMAINNVFSRFDMQQEKNVPEDTFLNIKSDIAVLKHLRYLPVIKHSHSFIELVYIFEGQCNHRVGDTDFEMKKGDVCIVAPDVMHCISVFDDNSIILNILVRRSTFNTTFFELLTEDNILSDFFARIVYGANKLNPYILFRAGEDELLQSIVLDLYYEYKDQEKFCFELLNILFKLFCILLLRNHEKNVIVFNHLSNKQDDDIIHALKYIQNNYNNNNLKLSSVAKMFNYSEGHFSRLIKEYTGRTFSEIVREIKIKKAAELYMNPSISVKEIVEEVGYTDISHFYRSFKWYYGMTPKEYRNKRNMSTDCKRA